MKSWFKLSKYDRYVLKKFLKTFVVMLSLFTLIIIVFDLAEKLEDFTQKEAPVKLIVTQYYLNFIPSILNQFSAIFVFLSVIFFTSQLASRSEFIAVLASGVSFNRMMKPYLVGAIILLIGTYLLNSWLVPISDKKRVDFATKWIRNTNTEWKGDIHQQIKPGVFLYLRHFNRKDSTGQHLILQEFDSLKQLSRLYAVSIKPSKIEGKWELTNVTSKEFDSDGAQEIRKFSTLDTAIAFNPNDLFRRLDDMNSFNNNELREYIAALRLKGTEEINHYITELYRRFAAPFAVLLLTLIGFAVSARKARGGVGVHLGKGILLSFFYLFLIKTFNTYGAQGSMHPAIAVWIPNIIFAGIALWLIYRAPK